MHEAGLHGVVGRLEEALRPAGFRIEGSLPQSWKSILSSVEESCLFLSFMILRFLLDFYTLLLKLDS